MITLIVNPAAGNGRSKKIVLRVEKALKQKKLPYRIWETSKPGNATQLARQAAEEHAQDPDPSSLLLVIGGDGTFLESVRGLMDHSLPIAQIPAGTGNDFLRTLQVPRKPLAALEHILNTTPRRIDLGTVNEDLFANECGAGFDVTVLDHAESAKRYVRGLAPYLWGVIKGIFTHRSQPMEIIADGEILFSGDCLVFSVANGRYIGGGIPISPRASVSDGLLDLIVVRSCRRLRMISYLPGLLQGKILAFQDTVVHKRVKEIMVRGLDDRSLRVNIDGEISNRHQCHFTICPGKLLIKM